MNTQRLIISLAMCTYNGARYLPQQLESILTQTRPPDEVVICDDRSADTTVDILNEFASRASFPVRIYTNDENTGSTKNFEQAISHCDGEIIALADQDDVWHPQKFERMVEAFSTSRPTGAVFTDGEIVDAALRPRGVFLWGTIPFTRQEQQRVRKGDAFQVLLRHNVVTGATMAFRAEYKRLILPIPEIWVHDGWIALLISAVADIGIIEQPLVSYRQHSESQIGAGKKKKRKAPRPFSEIYKDRINRFIAARERLLAMSGELHVPQSALLDLEAKIKHLQVRAALPRSRWSRFPIAVRELVTLRYHRYHNGMVSFANDLSRPVPKVGPEA